MPPFTVPPVTAVAGALLALLYLALAVRIVALRYRTRTSLGGGLSEPGNADRLKTPEARLFVAVRSHGNFAEYVPLALLLLAWVEAGSATRTLPVALAVALAVGRCLHPVGLHRPSPNAFRAAGVVLTFCVIGVVSSYQLGLAASTIMTSSDERRTRDIER